MKIIDMLLDYAKLNNKMDEGKYSEVFFEIREYLKENPTDKDVKKLYIKLQNEYKKREQKHIMIDIDTKLGFQLFDEALRLIEGYLEIIPDDKKALQLREKIIQDKVKYEIETGYNKAKEQYNQQNYLEAIKILTPLVKQYKSEQKLLKLKETVEKERWKAKFIKWESEAQEFLQNEEFDNALKKLELILKRDSSNKTIIKLREKILEDKQRTIKKRLWDEINSQVKIQNFSNVLEKIKELLEVDPNDSKAIKLQSSIIETQVKLEKKKVLELATAELNAYKFTDALETINNSPDHLQTDQDIMSLREKILAKELDFKLNNLISMAKKFIKEKRYQAAEDRIEEAIAISNNMSKSAIKLKAELQKKVTKNKIKYLIDILLLYRKSNNIKACMDIINQILELDHTNSKALKLKTYYEEELGIEATPRLEKPVEATTKAENIEPTPGEVQIVREYDYIGGEIRFKVAIRNLTTTAITNITILLNITEQYTIESLTKQVSYLAPGETRGVDFMLIPMACGQSKVFGTVSYSDAFGKPHSLTITPKTISIKCPLVIPEQSTRNEIKKWLKSQLRSSCSIELGNLSREQAFKIANDQIAAMDLSNVLMNDSELVAEFLGVAKVTQNKVLVRSTALQDRIKLDVFTDDMKSATGILAYIRNLINIAMDVQIDLQKKEDKIGIQILDAFEILGRITKLCDLCQILGSVKDCNLILNELKTHVEQSFLKNKLYDEITHWKKVFEKQKSETCSEDIANDLEYNAINWIKIIHQIAQTKYDVYKETFDSSYSAAANKIQSRVDSIADEIRVLENAYMRRMLKYLMIIYKENGLVLFTHAFGEIEINSDLIGGFLTAIQSFGMEISQKDTPVTKLAYKDFELELKDGTFVRIALVLSGKGNTLITEKLNLFTTDFEKKFKAKLKSWTGNIDPFKDLGPVINKNFNIIESE
ncbi:MAG: hypothetical protein ACFFD2_01870 [Promethearchaeota archaeon]